MLLNSLQALLVVSSSWKAVDGRLYRCERATIDSPWECVGEPIDVNLGKNGITWEKQEGDGKSPAGIFPLTTAFGDLSHHVTHFPYLLIVEGLECVDDPKSSHYNQFVKDRKEYDWESSEKMWLIGNPYVLGLVVGYNVDPIIPGKGSCIFMHVWSQKGKGTAGCTAMKETDLINVVSWLESKKNPILIQLPATEYIAKKELWNLFNINNLKKN